mgnify:CR=1 FL=1
MNIISQITNCKQPLNGLIFNISHSINQLQSDFNYDNSIRKETHPMHKYYLDNYGSTFRADKYIESILNYQNDKKYLISFENINNPYDISVWLLNKNN